MDFPQERRGMICHRELHHILHCKQRHLSTGLHSGGVLVFKKCGAVTFAKALVYMIQDDASPANITFPALH